MCSVCLQSPCSSRCPNAPEPIPVPRCNRCGEGIYDGDKYLDSTEGPICEDYVDDMTSYEMMKAMEYELSTVEKEEF